MPEASHAADPTPPPASEREHAIVATLHRVGTLVGRFDDASDAIPRILEELAGFFGADSVELALIDPDTGALVLEFTVGFPAEHHQAQLPPGVGLIGWAALHQKPVVAPDVLDEPRHLPMRPATRSMMAVPFEIDGHFHGVFALESDRARAFDEAALATFERLALEAAGVLRRLWLIDHLRRKAAQLEALAAIGQELAGKLQPEELMETVTRESQRLTGCRVAMLQLYDAARKELRLQAIHPPGSHFEKPEEPRAIIDCLAGSAVTTRRQVEFSHLDQPQFADLQDIPRRSGVAAVLFTPLVADGEVAGVLAVFTDRTHRFSNDERHLLRALASLASVALQNARLYQRVFASEESLRQSERLTTLGLLAAEIAHETRNPLTVIRLLFGALDLDFPADDPRRTDVAIIREKLGQLESFVTRVLTLAKAPASLHARWPLDDLVRETCLLLRLKLQQARIHLHYEPPAEPLAVDCHKGQIQQVLLNVLLNATQAMPDGGAITITCRRQQAPTAAFAIVEIGDTGHGMPPEFRDRVFDSFLSGRADGTGLGLAIAKRIMRAHHGDIEIAATGAAGTVMRIALPVAP
jgi:signal transduction histidine kinase